MPSRGRRTRDEAAHAPAVLPVYTDGMGSQRRPPPEVIRQLNAAIAATPSDDAAPVIVIAGTRRFTLGASTGSRPAHATLSLEDGGELPVRIDRREGREIAVASQEIPLGTHTLITARGRDYRQSYILARPRTLARRLAQLGRRLIAFLPLYSVHPGGPFGIATYEQLRELCQWATSFEGVLFGTLPLYPTFLDKPLDPSPYAPVSRLVWSELFVDPRAAAEWELPAVRKAAAAGAGLHAPHAGLVDYRRCWKQARRVLKAMAAAAHSSPARWAQVLSGCTAETVRYASFRAAVDETRTTPEHWPVALRRAVLSGQAGRAENVNLYLCAQSLALTQLGDLSASGGRGSLYLDLPVGVHPSGFDVFTRPDLFLQGFSAGAPPDALNARGQVWGFPPMHPAAGRADGYLYLRSVLRRMFSVCKCVRIDHVMGLFRMFCVPLGHDGSDGAYLRYPEQELFALVMIEAAKANAVVVGEDLGTVPAPVRQIMKREGLLGMHVQQFALDGPGDHPIVRPGPHALASLNTHDTPTFAGFWNGDDIPLRVSLGLLAPSESKKEHGARDATRRTITKELRSLALPSRSAKDAALSIMRLQSQSPAPLVLVNLEDLWGERRPQNVPGTSTEHANWRRLAARPLHRILRDPAIARALATLARDRREPKGGRR